MRIRRLLPSTLAAVLAVAGLAFDSDHRIVSADAPQTCRDHLDPDTGEDTGLDLCRSDVWVHDTGTKVNNAGEVTGYPGWDTTPPDTSVAGGAGGGAAATSLLHQTDSPWETRESLVLQGTYDGAFDTLAFELFLFPPAGMAQSQTDYRVDARITVDGFSVATIGDLTVPMVTDGNAVQRIQFGVTNLLESQRLWGVTDLAGSHEIQVVLHGTGIASNAAVFVYDTTEVPTGMIFNFDPAAYPDLTTIPAY